MCPKCGWKQTDRPVPASIQTVNHDHSLTHIFHVAESKRFKLVPDNPAYPIEKPDLKDEGNRIAGAAE